MSRKFQQNEIVISTPFLHFVVKARENEIEKRVKGSLERLLQVLRLFKYFFCEMINTESNGLDLLAVSSEKCFEANQRLGGIYFLSMNLLNT